MTKYLRANSLDNNFSYFPKEVLSKTHKKQLLIIDIKISLVIIVF